MSILIPKFRKFEQSIKVGEYDIVLPDPPNLKDIAGYGLPEADQMWKPPVRPNPRTMSKAQIEGWQDQMVEKCYHTGHWLFINGRITYLTPAHFMFCGFWPIDIGLPEFRFSNAKFFYLWRDVELDDKCIGLIEITNRRDGKCFGINTPIRMYDGSVKMVQDIRDGELVMGPDSSPRKTTGCTAGKENMYRIVPNKGDSFTCNESHILSLVYTGKDSKMLGYKNGQIVNISVREYLKLPQWCYQFLVLYREGWGTHWKSNTHQIPPYILGVWLGDGCSSNGKFTSADQEIIDSVSSYGQSMGMPISFSKSDKYTFGLMRAGSGTKITVHTESGPVSFDSIKEAALSLDGSYNDKKKKLKEQSFYKRYKCEIDLAQENNAFRAMLSEMGLLNNKHIPDSYLIDSVANRLELLAGLIDTDGYLAKTKEGRPRQIEITQKNKKIADGVVELCRSLGFYCHINTKTATMRRKDETIYSCEVYRINIFGDLHRIPCRIPRKQAEKVGRRVNSKRTGFSVEPIGLGDYYGFAVDKDSLFLLADGTVVHNTYRGGFIVYHRSSVTSNTMGGIQSKTDNDAKKVFRKAVVNPFKKLPKFLQPTWDGNTNPRSELNFYAPTRQMKNTDDFELDEALETSIDFRSVVEEAYDGEYLAAYFRDEYGKTVKANVAEGHEFTRYCFYKGSDIVGKALYSTTVEEMEKKGGKNALMLWNDSDPEHAAKDALGQTVSNMRRYFKPGYEGMEGRHPITRQPFIDRYGFDVLGPDGFPIAKHYLEQRREKLINAKDWNKLASEKRKYPFTVEEAFRQDAKECHFNAEILQERLSFLNSRHYQENPDYIQGDFLWKNGEADSEVVWVPNAEGRFLVWKLPDPQLWNAMNRDSFGRKVPGNVDMFGAGSDSYDHKKVENQARASNLAFYVGRKFDAAVDVPTLPKMWCTTRLPWLEYVNRPPRPEDAWEDCLKACVFYGCRVFPETNKPGMRNYFENRGYINYLQDRPDWTYTNPNANHENTKGQASTLSAIEQYTDLHTTWVEERALACRFPRLLQHLLDFEIDNTTKYDCAVAWGFALICLGVRPTKGIASKSPGSGFLPMGDRDITILS